MNFLLTPLNELFPPWLANLLARGIGFALILLAGLLASLLISFLVARMKGIILAASVVRKDDRGEYPKRIDTLLGLLKTVLVTVVWFIVVFTLLSHAGVDITPLLASAGILGLAVGFGAQNLVRDVISGFFHIMEDQIRVGDVVRVNGIGGLVERVTYRIIVLRDLEQVVHVIPHGKVDTLANMTKDVSAMVIDIGVSYREHPDEVLQALRDVATEMSADPQWQPVLLEPLEILGLDAFADSSVLYRVRYKTKPIEQWNVKREFQRRIKIAFDRRGIEFPFPQRTLQWSDATPALPVRILPEPQEEADPETGAGDEPDASVSEESELVREESKDPD